MANAFRFLSLPAELRNRIYEMVFHRSQSCNLTAANHSRGGRAFQHHVAQPSLTRTCQQIRNETLPVFYGSNWFLVELRPWMHAAVHTRTWLKAVLPKNRQFFKQLYVNSQTVNFSVLGELSGDGKGIVRV